MHLPSLAVSVLLPSALASPLLKRDSWGGSVSLGPTTSHIVHAVTTLIPGLPPSSQSGELFLWPGMSNGTGDLIQTTLEQWPDNSWCGAVGRQWCVRASLFGSFGQLDGDASVVTGDMKVRIEYTRGEVSGNGWVWTQNVTNADTGEYLSSFAHVSGTMTGWGTGTECDDECSGTVATQQYLDTTITLESADSSFGSTIATAQGATYSNLASTQSGKVWSIDEINILAMVS